MSGVELDLNPVQAITGEGEILAYGPAARRSPHPRRSASEGTLLPLAADVVVLGARQLAGSAAPRHLTLQQLAGAVVPLAAVRF